MNDYSSMSDQELSHLIQQLELARSKSRQNEFMQRGGGRPIDNTQGRTTRSVRSDQSQVMTDRKKYDALVAEQTRRVKQLEEQKQIEEMTGHMREATGAIAPWGAGALATAPLMAIAPAVSAGLQNLAAIPGVGQAWNLFNTAGGLYMLGSDQGVKKTMDLYNQEGLTGRTVRSGLGDAWNIMAALTGLANLSQLPNVIAIGRSMSPVVYQGSRPVMQAVKRGAQRTYSPPRFTNGRSPRGRGEWMTTSQPRPVSTTVPGWKYVGQEPIMVSGPSLAVPIPPLATPPLPFVPGLPSEPSHAPNPPYGVPGKGMGYMILPTYGSVETHDPGFETWFRQQEPGTVGTYNGVAYLIEWSKNPWRHDVDRWTGKRSASYEGEDTGDYRYYYGDGRSEDESSWYTSPSVPNDYQKAKATGVVKQRK